MIAEYRSRGMAHEDYRKLHIVFEIEGDFADLIIRAEVVEELDNRGQRPVKPNAVRNLFHIGVPGSTGWEWEFNSIGRLHGRLL